MRQVLQDLRSGETTLADVPAPGGGAQHLLIRTRASLISAGTERSMVEFGQASWIGKARAQPDKVKQVLEKIRADGLWPTLEAVFAKLDEPLPLGYCNAGVVLETGREVRGFRPGDRVASNGPHAEVVAVPQNLCARIPDGVSDEAAAFTVLASIALQGVRLAAPTLGETVVVQGLGLIGLLTVQILAANGCEVIGVDLSPERLALAAGFGARTVDARSAGDVAAAVLAATGGRGADAVLLTASTKSADLVHDAAVMCRKRGRIVLVGVVPLELRRSDFYEKELTLQVSCSYGPGRYDERYEQGGQDYPLGFVRWTEQRNFEAVLSLLASGRLEVAPLVTHRVPIDRAGEAYRTVQGDPSALGVLLQYPADRPVSTTVTVAAGAAGAPSAGVPAGRPGVALVGAGNFAKAVLGPALARCEARRVAVVERAKAPAAAHLAKKCGFERATTDLAGVWADPAVHVAFVATPHDSHAALAIQALEAGKHVFVEKPMALSPEEVSRVAEALARAPGRQYGIGFNRRFSPHVARIRELLAGRSEPLAMRYAVNAGAIPPDSWLHDPQVGGGRIVGEGCHFVDLLASLAGSPVTTVSAAEMGPGPAVREDKTSMVLSFADGSVGSVDYYANGDRSYPKEILEVFSQGRVLRLENYRRTTGWGFKGFRRFKTRRQDKGHRALVAAFLDRVAKGGEPLMPLPGLVNVTLATFAARTAARERRTVVLADEYPALAAAAGLRA